MLAELRLRLVGAKIDPVVWAPAAKAANFKRPLSRIFGSKRLLGVTFRPALRTNGMRPTAHDRSLIASRTVPAPAKMMSACSSQKFSFTFSLTDSATTALFNLSLHATLANHHRPESGLL